MKNGRKPLLRIGIGKRYRMRNGGITAPLRGRDPNDTVYVATDGFSSWTKYGTYYQNGNMQHPYDLVAEYYGPELVRPLDRQDMPE